MRFCGLDLAWSRRNPSGGVVLALEGKHGVPVLWESSLGSDEEILDFILAGTKGEPPLIAIDAPLIVPNQTGSRRCDRELSAVYRHAEAATYPANRRLLGPQVRGEEIVRRLAARGFILSPLVGARRRVRQIIEVYPHPALVELFGLERTLKYKARPGRPLELRQRELARYMELLRSLSEAEPALDPEPILSQLAPRELRGSRFKRAEDLLDALFCAYIALYVWWHGPAGYHVFGDLATGFIVVPIPAGS